MFNLNLIINKYITHFKYIHYILNYDINISLGFWGFGVPTRFVLIEAFRSEAAIAAHREAPHYLVWRDTVTDMMAETRSSIRLNSLDPSDTDW